MQQFIPFEDEWDILERLSPESLIPYHVGVPCRHDLAVSEYGATPAVSTASSSSTGMRPLPSSSAATGRRT